MLREAKANGMEVIPAAECDNYDERGVCKGHENPWPEALPVLRRKGALALCMR